MLTPSLLLTLVPTFALAGGPSPGEPTSIIDTRVADLDGVIHHLGTAPHAAPVALVFMDTQCPISNRYVPRLNELAGMAAAASIQFFSVITNPHVSRREAAAHRDEFGVAFPVLFDSSGELAARLRPTHVPEAFVITADDRLVYRGRIDDQFESVTRRRERTSSHDLRDALRAVAAGDFTPRLATTPVGCVFESWSAPTGAEVTYHRDVAPILNAYCADCHREGDIGPFALESYAPARRRARMIAEVCETRIMPPWHAAPNDLGFRDERRLSDGQIAILRAWAEAGAPEGDPADALPPPPRPSGDWRLGEPDLVIEMPVEYEIPADGPDIYRYFVVPTGLDEERTIVAYDFRPGDPSVVHHCIAYVDENERARALDERDPEPGFSLFGGGGDFQDDAVGLAGWAPGSQPYKLPDGLGMILPADADVVLEIHYHLTGKPTRDRSRLALYFADEPVERLVHGMVIGTEQIDIAPGDRDYRRHVWTTLPCDVDLIDISPHMHYLGREVTAVTTLPDGRTQPLLHVPRWDFRWQDVYTYREPLRLPAGTRIEAEFRFDNSADNPFNPSSPPRRVREGWETTDEMCLLYLTVAPVDTGKAGLLDAASIASFLRPAGD